MVERVRWFGGRWNFLEGRCFLLQVVGISLLLLNSNSFATHVSL